MYFYTFLTTAAALLLAGGCIAWQNQQWLKARDRFQIVDKYCTDLQALMMKYWLEDKGAKNQPAVKKLENEITGYSQALITFCFENYSKREDVLKRLIFLLNVTSGGFLQQQRHADVDKLVESMQAIANLRSSFAK